MNAHLPLWGLVISVTLARLIILALTPTDLFFDEAQYWAWAQGFDWGYFSKPPMIAWVIGGVTSVFGSDTPFVIRSAAPIFHGATALILGYWMGQIHRPAEVWTAAVYLSMPILAIGSWMISTDTIMVPFLALALWAWWRYLESDNLVYATLAGVSVGLAMMGKYAGIYFWMCISIAAFFPALRAPLRGVFLAVLMCLIVLSPNLIWNLQNGFVTFSHTADNAQAGRDIAMNWIGLAEFLGTQVLVIGPVFFAVWLSFLWSRKQAVETYLLACSLPVLVLVCVQAWTAKANGNWAFAAYPAAAALVGLHLSRAEKWLRLYVGLAFNVTLVSAVTLLILWPAVSPRIMDRFTGRSATTAEILALAEGRALAADERQLLADLVYAAWTNSDGTAVYAGFDQGSPRHWYDMALPRPDGTEVLYVSEADTLVCGGILLKPETTLVSATGAYSGRKLTAIPLPADCR